MLIDVTNLYVYIFYHVLYYEHDWLPSVNYKLYELYTWK